MNITVAQLEWRLVQLRNEYFYLEGQLNKLPQPDGQLLEKIVKLTRTIELMEQEIDRRSGF